MSAPVLDMATLDAMPAADFAAALGDLFEHSPWVVEGLAGLRPFGSARRLHDAMMQRVREAGPALQRGLIAAHPELAGQEMSAGAMTTDSTSEQGRLGFDRLSAEEHAALGALNAAYRARFGLPCVVALSRHATRASVQAAMAARLDADPSTEQATAIEEIGHITASRLAGRLGRAHGALSVHALDTVRGGAAPGLGYTLHGERGGVWAVLASGRTNAQGRTDGPLLAGLDLEPGAYRVDYAVGAYHRAHGVAVTEPAFLEIVGIGFGIADAGAHYHIPLQFTPWSYATYRGG
jgi:2-oxo-4-hydroxy-4-carboxy-5-ureidoimidazoline decarboxylase